MDNKCFFIKKSREDETSRHFQIKISTYFFLTHEEKNSEIINLLFLMNNEGTW